MQNEKGGIKAKVRKYYVPWQVQPMEYINFFLLPAAA